MKKVVIIMAGGKGKRLWPISCEELPKQFLKLTSKETMLQLTIKRAMKIVDLEDIYIVTQPEYKKIAKEQILEVPVCNILAGPHLKSTTEAIAYSSAVIREKYKDAITIIMPSDHEIQEEKKFFSAVNKASNWANDNHIVTMGILPEYPETNYGYIKKGDMQANKVYKVEQFKEKPNIELAHQYFTDEKFLWNSGIFIWKNSLIIQEFEKYLPNVYYKISKLVELLRNSKSKNEIDQIFADIQTKSIDYEILEKSSNIYVVEANFSWTDIGNFKALKRVKKKDENNNIIEGKVITQESKNNILLSKEKLIVTLGVENLMVVETGKEIFIINTANQNTSPSNILIETIQKEKNKHKPPK